MANSETSKERIRSTRDREQPGDTPDTTTSRAIASFKRMRLSTQRMLAREIATTRGDDLSKAYPDIIDVTVGNRSRRDPSTGRSRVVRETCVILVIERKKTHVAEKHRLPEVLMTYHTVRGKRLLVAVPVDVEERSALAGATPDAAPTRLAVFCGDVSPAFGQACCAVRFPLVPDAIMAVSCKHVFTLEAMLHGEFKSSLIYLADDPEEVAEIAITLDRAGALRKGTPAADFSFDAQLADVFGNDDAKARLHAVLGDVTLVGVVEGFDMVPHDLWVQTSRGPIKVEFDEQAPRVAKIVYPSIGDVYHQALIISQFQHPFDLQKGDSGSAVTTEKNGGQLVGMHIGSDQEQFRAYAIPGWQLLDPRKYTGSLDIEKWELVDPATLPPAPKVNAVAVVAAPDGLVLPPSGASHDEFAKFAFRACTELAKEYPINATVAAGQCILESGWGQSRGTIEHGIYFGIKASSNYSGKRILQKTREDFGNSEVEVTDSFRAYDDWWSSFRDYGELIGKAKRYARARQSKNNPGNYLKEIKAAGYATDPNYVEKVKKIVNERADILGGPI